MADPVPAPVAESQPRLPPTERLYLDDTYAFALPSGAHVLAVVKEADAKTGTLRTAVVLDQTLFHPQGGGQPADQGTIVLLRRKEQGEEEDGGGCSESLTFSVDSVRDDGTGALRHYGSFVGDVAEGEGFRPGDEVSLQAREKPNQPSSIVHNSIDLTPPIPSYVISHRLMKRAAASTRASTPPGTPWTSPWPGSGSAGSA